MNKYIFSILPIIAYTIAGLIFYFFPVEPVKNMKGNAEYLYWMIVVGLLIYSVYLFCKDNDFSTNIGRVYLFICFAMVAARILANTI